MDTLRSQTRRHAWPILVALLVAADTAHADLDYDVDRYLADVSLEESEVRPGLLALANSGGQGSGVEQTPPKDWSAAITLYAWMAAFSIDTPDASVDGRIEDVIDQLDFALMIRGDFSWKRFTFVIDYIYADFSNTNTRNFATRRIDVRQDILDLLFGYMAIDTRPARGQPGFVLVPEIGARYFDTRASYEVRVPALIPGNPDRVAQFQAGPSWWDLMVGVRAHWVFTPKFGFTLQAHVGGFGIGNSAKYNWDVSFLTHFRLAKWVEFEVGYGVLQFRRDFKVTMHGPIIGFTFTF